MQTAAHRLNETQSKEGVRQTQVMKSYPPESGPPDHSMKGHQNNQPEKLPIEDMEKIKNGESEKDSGYSDSSSESISSEETPRSSKGDEPKTSEGTTQAQTTYTPIYILQNVVLKQPRILLVQQPVRCHGKRPNPSSYLPILRSYPRIAPRLTTHPASSPKASPPDRIPSPTVRNPPKKSHKPPQLLDISLRSVALLHRTRETQRSIRELRAHTKLYQRALRGEEGGWERLRRAMERSGVYRGSKWSSAAKASSLAEEPIEEGKRPSVMAAVLLEEAIGSPMTDIDMEEDTVEGRKVDAV